MSGAATVATAAVQLDGLARDLLTRAAQGALLWVQPSGGQARARRNAWSSMVRDTQRRAQRLEVERSIALANATAAASTPDRRRITA